MIILLFFSNLCFSFHKIIFFPEVNAKLMANVKKAFTRKVCLTAIIIYFDGFFVFQPILDSSFLLAHFNVIQ